MHPLVQAVVVSVLLAASAAGQQPFYSNNGNHQQYPSPSYQANSAGPYAPSSSNYQQQPYNLGYQQQQTYTQQTYQQPQAYTQQSQQGYSQQQSAASSYSQQSYAAPYNAPSPTSQSYAAYPQPQYRSIGGAQSSSKNPIQSPAKVSSIDSKLSPAPSQQTPLTQYGSALPQTYSTTHQLEQQQQQQQQKQPQQQSYAAGPAQSSFSNRQLPLNYENNGFASNNMAPPTTMASYNSYVGPTSTVGLNPHQLANRRGPFDKMINRAKEWMPGRGKKNGGPRRNPGSSYSGSDGMSEMHRLPKPPKYPLYDMPSQGMVTPPPPPLMSPMAQMPSMSQLYSTFSLPPNDRPHQNPKPKRGGGGRRRPAAKLPSITAKPHVENKRRRARPPLPLPMKQNKRHRNRGKTPNPNGGSLSGRNPSGPASYQDGFDHPMASNMNPVSSPALGRPLGYEEYMKRPTHSFTDDPWNFDPNAQHYNEGMNTHAMKYNYDPLGTNTLDTSVQSHLDISKMSYPGDIHSMDTMKEPPKPLNSQLGGWDVHPSNYRENSNNYNNYNSQQNNNNPPSHLLVPPSHSQSHSQPPSQSQSKHNRFDQRQSASSLLFDDIVPSTTTLRNSFNQYDQTTEASIVKSETLNPLTLLSDGGIEFDIDATLKSQAPTTTYDYKLSDHYSPSADTSHHSSSNSNSNSNRDNYDPYSSSSYSRYSQDNAYGSRRTRANYRQQQAHGHHGKNVNLINSSTPSTSSVTEGIGVFHDFIKDPNPGVGKARARHSLFNALMS